MKTAAISTPTHEFMLVELSEKAREPKLFNDKDRPYISYFDGIETPRFYLPEGDWKELGFVSGLKESEVEPYIEKVMQGQHYQNYKIRQNNNLSDWSSFIWCRTALESFLSLLETKIYFENPYENPDRIEHLHADKERTLVFVKKNKPMKLHITILGTPQPKQSARFRTQKFGSKSFVKSYQTDEVQHKERNFAFDAKSQLPEGFMPFSGAVRMKALFVFAPLKSFSKSKLKAMEEGEVFYKSTKPDLQDNLMKLTCDALEGIVFNNDSQICEVSSRKIYGAVPRVELIFESLE